MQIYWLLTIGMLIGCSVQDSHSNRIIPTDFVNEIPSAGTVDSIPVLHTAPLVQAGGHLQGIQLLNRADQQRWLLSGSSDSMAFLAELSGDSVLKTEKIYELAHAPLKHAGGIQVYDRFLAVGIEDNESRDLSEVVIYDMEEVAPDSLAAITKIHREGPRERATAGCIGFTKYRDHMLLAVGDWDTRHLDFYACPMKNWENGMIQFDSVNTVTTSQLDQVDPAIEWLPYQNINMFTDEQGNLYLAGMARSALGQDMLHIYQLEAHPHKGLFSFDFKLVATRSFGHSAGTSFQLGAGIHWKHGKRAQVFSTPRHLQTGNHIRIWK